MVDLHGMFTAAANIASEYFTDAARNANVLNRKKDDFSLVDTSSLIRPFASQQIELKSPVFIGELNLDPIFAPINRDLLLQWFEQNQKSPLYFILLGCVTGINEFTPTFARDSFELHSTIQMMNGCVRGVKQGNAHMRSALGYYCDLVMLRAKLFQGSMIHAANTSTDELAVAFLKLLLSLRVGPELDSNMQDQAKERHAKLVADYRVRFDHMVKELIANAYDKQQMTQWVKQPMTLRTMPVWFMCPYTEQDAVINDTWASKLWGESLMQSIIHEQTKALAEQRS